MGPTKGDSRASTYSIDTQFFRVNSRRGQETHNQKQSRITRIIQSPEFVQFVALGFTIGEFAAKFHNSRNFARPGSRTSL